MSKNPVNMGPSGRRVNGNVTKRYGVAGFL
jgi:hypothetical protein